MGEVKLNLARKWRSKNFDEIIGQDLLIRMLKNGLYLQQYFPVYLFSGQRGCGKTSTARVFAAALNCDQLYQFQRKPQEQPIPCLSCVSCKAMGQGKHPDFIEIDAASHTGVDNVRTLIDSASLLPLMGRKKIYLIDEAHMLSKAAFNALLKILEEPPSSALFILATTDPQKIIETVRSRCFQLFFKPVETDILKNQLRMICDAEKISYDDAGLITIVKQTDGSVRDALNLLEQIRFSSSSVTHEAVLRALGHIDDQALMKLFVCSLQGSPSALLETIAQMEWKQFSAHIIWNRMLELIRTALWIRHDIVPAEFTAYHAEIRKLVKPYSVRQLSLFLQTMYDQELIFSKTTAKHEFLEMVLLQFCQQMKKGGNNNGSPASVVVTAVEPSQDDAEGEDDESTGDQEEEQDDDLEDEGLRASWKQVMHKINQLNDPLVRSIFVQAVPKGITEQGEITIEFPKDVSFFNGLLQDTKTVWRSLLEEAFGKQVTLVPQFTGAPLPKKKKEEKELQLMQHSTSSAKQTLNTASRGTNKSGSYAGGQSREKGFRRPFIRQSKQEYKPFAQELAIDISDQEVWRTSHLILKHIPGTITEIKG